MEYRCLNARCSSCIAKVVSGETKNKEEEFVLTEEEKRQNFVLSPKVIERIDGDHSIWEQESLKGLAEDGELMSFKL